MCMNVIVTCSPPAVGLALQIIICEATITLAIRSAQRIRKRKEEISTDNSNPRHRGGRSVETDIIARARARMLS